MSYTCTIHRPTRMAMMHYKLNAYLLDITIIDTYHINCLQAIEFGFIFGNQLEKKKYFLA